MKRSLIYAIACVTLAAPMVSLASEFRFGEQPALLSGENKVGDFYIVGGSVTSAGAVTGDIAAAGGMVVMSGDIGTDVLAVGGNISILSNIGDDLRVGGGTVVIVGKVGGDVLVGGGQVTLGGSGVGGDVVIGAGNVRIDAPIAGNLRIGGGTVYLNAPVKGSVTIDADRVTLGPSAVLYGPVSYKAGKAMIREEGSEVRGEVSYTSRATKQVPAALIAGLISAWVLGKFLIVLVCALAIGLVFRRYMREVMTRAAKQPLLEAGRGFLVLVALPVASVLLLVSLVGVPLGVLGILSLVALVMIACLISPIIVGSFVHRYVFKGDLEVTWKTILLGVVIFQLLGFFPIIGGLVQFAVLLIAIGVIASIKWQVIKEWR